MTTTEAARELDGLVRALHRSLIARTRKRLGAPALSAARAQLLWVVHRLQPVTIGALSRHLYQSKSTVSAAADTMVRAGLLRRSRPADDRRVVMLRLSGRGEEAIRAALAARQRLLAQALRQARGTPAARLVTMLSEVLRALEATEARAEARAEAGTNGRPPAASSARRAPQGAQTRPTRTQRGRRPTARRV